VFAAAVFAVTTVAQTPQPMPAPPLPRQEAGVRRHFNFPAPTNLQVLPKNLTGKQVHQIMGKWARSLGTHCSTCHAPNPNAAPAPNGHPHLDFALDIKPEKKTARLMVKMVEDINGNYVGKINIAGIFSRRSTFRHRSTTDQGRRLPRHQQRRDNSREPLRQGFQINVATDPAGRMVAIVLP
jgi:hypothetical protein